jgi:hypothetical protein
MIFQEENLPTMQKPFGRGGTMRVVLYSHAKTAFTKALKMIAYRLHGGQRREKDRRQARSKALSETQPDPNS